MPFNIVPSVIWLAVVGAIFAGLFVLAEQLRAGAKAEVHAEYAEAARRKNIVIGELNSAQDAVDAIAEATIATRLAQAQAVPGTCPATKEQATALTAIRRGR